MSYEDLTPEQQCVIDAMMDDCGSVRMLAERLHCKERTMKSWLRNVYDAYGISRKRFLPMIRLAYLRSKELGLLAMCLLVLGLTCQAQAASRPVVLSWTASTSSSVNGNAIYRCTVVSPATSCIPNTTGTPLATVGTVSTYTDFAATGATYGYAVTATAPPCTPTSSPNTPCGNSPPLVLGAVPVPPQVAGVTSIVVVVP